MKKYFRFLVYLCLLNPVYAQIPTNGLINRFTFNGTLNGSQGGAISGIISPSYVPDRNNAPSSAINTISSNNATSNAGISNLPTGSNARTVAFWFKANPNSIHSLFNYGSSTGSSTFALALENTSTNSKVVFFNGSTESFVNRPFSSAWMHLAAVYNGTSITLYINGVSVLNALTTVNVPASYISRIGHSPGGNFYGNFQMDDLLFYNRALTANEVNVIYTGCGISAPVNVTNPQNLNICAGQTATLSVTGTRTIKWYTTASGGTSIDTGFTITTNPLNTTTTFYAESDSGSCVSERSAITVNVTPLTNPTPPAILTDTLSNYCIGNRVLLEASATVGTIRWYNVISGGQALDTGRNFFTPPLNSDTIYFAELFTGCGSQSVSARVPVKIKVNGTSDLSDKTPDYLKFLCTRIFVYPTQLSVQTNAQANNVSWRLNGSGAVLGTGKTFSTPTSVSVDTTYWVTAKSSCVATMPIFVKTYDYNSTTIQNLTQTGSTPICPGDTVTLKSSKVDQIPLNWTNSAGEVVGWGDSIRVALSRNGTYQVKRGLYTCASNPTTIQFPVKVVPVATITVSNDTIRSLNSFDSYTLYRNGAPVSSSSSSGNFAVPASCGSYVAVFTNTTNTCGNLSALVRRTQIPAGSGAGCYYYDFQSFSNLQYPAYWSWSLNGQPGEPNVPINPTGVTSTTNWICPSSGTLNIRVKSANGCEYRASITIQNLTSIYSQLPGGIAGVDTLTNCNIISNTINKTSMANGITVTGGQGIFCYGDTVTTSATLNAPGQIIWYDTLGATTPFFTGNSFFNPPLTSSKRYYYARSFEGCESPRLLASLDVRPEINISLKPSDTVVCSGKPLTMKSNFINFASYRYEYGNIFQNAPGNFLIFPTASSIVTLKVTKDGCSKTDTARIQVINNSTSSYNFNICPGSYVVFSGDTLRTEETRNYTSTNFLGCDSVITVRVFLSNQIQQNINAKICSGQTYRFKGADLSIAGIYRDTIKTAGGCDSIVVLNLSVSQLPIPTIVQNGFELSTQVFNTYQWKLNNNEIPGAVFRTYIPAVIGSYTVVVQDSNFCTGTSENVDVTTVGIVNNLGSKLDFNLFPNPAQQVINFTELPIGSEISITDCTGKILLNTSYVEPNTAINISNLSNGVYLVTANHHTKTSLKRLVINR